MYKLILFCFVILIPINSVAGNFGLKANGYEYSVTEKKELAISNKKSKKVYKSIKFEKNEYPNQTTRLITINGMAAIMHRGEDSKMAVPTYYTLKTSLEGITTIDCIYRNFTIARKEGVIYLPYSVCNIDQSLTSNGLRYKLPQADDPTLAPDRYPYRLKIQQLNDVSLFYFFKTKYSDGNYVVQYKDKQINLSRSNDYILGIYNNNKKGLFKIIRNNSINYSIEGIEIEELKQKILNEGILFIIDNPNVLTEQPSDVEFISIVE